MTFALTISEELEDGDHWGYHDLTITENGKPYLTVTHWVDEDGDIDEPVAAETIERLQGVVNLLNCNLFYTGGH